MSSNKTYGPPRTDFGSPPPGYIPGKGRGATGFTTRADLVLSLNPNIRERGMGPAELQRLREREQQEAREAAQARALAPHVIREEQESEAVFQLIDQQLQSRKRYRESKPAAAASGAASGAAASRDATSQYIEIVAPTATKELTTLKQGLGDLSTSEWLALPDSVPIANKKVAANQKLTNVVVPQSLQLSSAGLREVIDHASNSKYSYAKFAPESDDHTHDLHASVGGAALSRPADPSLLGPDGDDALAHPAKRLRTTQGYSSTPSSNFYAYLRLFTQGSEEDSPPDVRPHKKSTAAITLPRLFKLMADPSSNESIVSHLDDCEDPLYTALFPESLKAWEQGGSVAVPPKQENTPLSISATRRGNRDVITNAKHIVTMLQNLTRTNPLDSNAWLSLAQAEFDAGNYQKAREVINTACLKCKHVENVWLYAVRLFASIPADRLPTTSSETGEDQSTAQLVHPQCDVVILNGLRYHPQSLRLHLLYIENSRHVATRINRLRDALTAFDGDNLYLSRLLVNYATSESEVDQILTQLTTRYPHRAGFWRELVLFRCHQHRVNAADIELYCMAIIGDLLTHFNLDLPSFQHRLQHVPRIRHYFAAVRAPSPSTWSEQHLLELYQKSSMTRQLFTQEQAVQYFWHQPAPLRPSGENHTMADTTHREHPTPSSLGHVTAPWTYGYSNVEALTRGAIQANKLNTSMWHFLSSIESCFYERYIASLQLLLPLLFATHQVVSANLLQRHRGTEELPVDMSLLAFHPQDERGLDELRLTVRDAEHAAVPSLDPIDIDLALSHYSLGAFPDHHIPRFNPPSTSTLHAIHHIQSDVKDTANASTTLFNPTNTIHLTSVLFNRLASQITRMATETKRLYRLHHKSDQDEAISTLFSTHVTNYDPIRKVCNLYHVAYKLLNNRDPESGDPQPSLESTVGFLSQCEDHHQWLPFAAVTNAWLYQRIHTTAAITESRIRSIYDSFVNPTDGNRDSIASSQLPSDDILPLLIERAKALANEGHHMTSKAVLLTVLVFISSTYQHITTVLASAASQTQGPTDAAALLPPLSIPLTFQQPQFNPDAQQLLYFQTLERLLNISVVEVIGTYNRIEQYLLAESLDYFSTHYNTVSGYVLPLPHYTKGLHPSPHSVAACTRQQLVDGNRLMACFHAQFDSLLVYSYLANHVPLPTSTAYMLLTSLYRELNSTPAVLYTLTAASRISNLFSSNHRRERNMILKNYYRQLAAQEASAAKDGHASKTSTALTNNHHYLHRMMVNEMHNSRMQEQNSVDFTIVGYQQRLSQFLRQNPGHSQLNQLQHDVNGPHDSLVILPQQRSQLISILHNACHKQTNLQLYLHYIQLLRLFGESSLHESTLVDLLFNEEHPSLRKSRESAHRPRHQQYSTSFQPLCHQLILRYQRHVISWALSMGISLLGTTSSPQSVTTPSEADSLSPAQLDAIFASIPQNDQKLIHSLICHFLAKSPEFLLLILELGYAYSYGSNNFMRAIQLFKHYMEFYSTYTACPDMAGIQPHLVLALEAFSKPKSAQPTHRARVLAVNTNRNTKTQDTPSYSPVFIFYSYIHLFSTPYTLAQHPYEILVRELVPLHFYLHPYNPSAGISLALSQLALYSTGGTDLCRSISLQLFRCQVQYLKLFFHDSFSVTSPIPIPQSHQPASHTGERSSLINMHFTPEDYQATPVSRSAIQFRQKPVPTSLITNDWLLINPTTTFTSTTITGSTQLSVSSAALKAQDLPPYEQELHETMRTINDAIQTSERMITSSLKLPAELQQYLGTDKPRSATVQTLLDRYNEQLWFCHEQLGHLYMLQLQLSPVKLQHQTILSIFSKYNIDSIRQHINLIQNPSSTSTASSASEHGHGDDKPIIPYSLVYYCALLQWSLHRSTHAEKLFETCLNSYLSRVSTTTLDLSPVTTSFKTPLHHKMDPLEARIHQVISPQSSAPKHQRSSRGPSTAAPLVTNHDNQHSLGLCSSYYSHTYSNILGDILIHYLVFRSEQCHHQTSRITAKDGDGDGDASSHECYCDHDGDFSSLVASIQLKSMVDGPLYSFFTRLYFQQDPSVHELHQSATPHDILRFAARQIRFIFNRQLSPCRHILSGE